MSTGVSFFAYNTPEIDYIKLAALCSLYVKRHMEHNTTCLITDIGSWEHFQKHHGQEQADHHFDHVVITEDTRADITEKQKVMLDFAVKTATNAAKISAADLEQLRTYGFSENDIWDIGAITALFALSNRMASLAAMRPNDEFYTMGRNF